MNHSCRYAVNWSSVSLCILVLQGSAKVGARLRNKQNFSPPSDLPSGQRTLAQRGFYKIVKTVVLIFQWTCPTSVISRASRASRASERAPNEPTRTPPPPPLQRRPPPAPWCSALIRKCKRRPPSSTHSTPPATREKSSRNRSQFERSPSPTLSSWRRQRKAAAAAIRIFIHPFTW